MTTWEKSRLSQDKLPQALSQGDVVMLDRVEEGIRFESAVYIRPHLMERKKVFDEFIASERYQKLYVTGPPGCGKTVFISLLARMYARDQNKRVLFVTYRDSGSCPVFAINGAEILQLPQANTPDSADLRNDLKALTKGQTFTFDLVLYDGVRQGKEPSANVLALFNQRVATKQIAKVIYVASLAFQFKGGDVLPDRLRIHDEDCFDSWMRDDYANAIQKMLHFGRFDQELLTEIRDQTLSEECKESSSSSDITKDMIESYLESKYFYAGGSARFMFDFSIERLKTHLETLIGAVKDVQWEAFATTSVLSATDDAVNSLMQRFPGRNGIPRCTAVSKYVTMVAYDKRGSAIADAVAAAAQATRNRALDGWAFELQQLEVIKKGFQPSPAATFVASDSGLAFLPTDEVHFDGDNLVGNIDAHGITIIWCLKWNQGCFDVAMYSEGTLITLQFTVSEAHSLKLEYVKDLRAQLLDKGVTVQTVGHIGINKDGQIKWTPISGTGRSNCEVEFTIQLSESSPLKISSSPWKNTACLLLEGTTIAMHSNKERHLPWSSSRSNARSPQKPLSRRFVKAMLNA